MEHALTRRSFSPPMFTKGPYRPRRPHKAIDPEANLVGAPATYRMICINPAGLPYLTPFMYSFGASLSM
jgi:hypothetical protein